MAIIRRERQKINRDQKAKMKACKRAGNRGSTGGKRTGGGRRIGRGKRNRGANTSRKRSGRATTSHKRNEKASASCRRSGRGERNRRIIASGCFIVILVCLLASSCSGSCLLQTLLFLLQLPIFFLRILFIIILIVISSHSLLDFTIITPIRTSTPFTESPLRVILSVRGTNLQELSWPNVHTDD